MHEEDDDDSAPHLNMEYAHAMPIPKNWLSVNSMRNGNHIEFG